MDLKFERISGKRRTQIPLSGEVRAEQLDQLKDEIERARPRVALDLEEVHLVDIEAVRFLKAEPGCAALDCQEKGRLMAKVDSQMQQDEILASVKIVVPVPADEVLVAAAKSGDHPAFLELWTRHSNKAFKTAYRITGNQCDAEDAFQDAWMRAYMHLKTFDGRAKFSTWLTRIAINSSLMILRAKRAHPETSIEITDGDTWQHWEIVDPTRNAEEAYVTHERVELLRRSICRLKPSLRNVLEIHQSNDSSLREVAEFAGISVAATKSRLSRAKKNLRKAFELKEAVTSWPNLPAQ